MKDVDHEARIPVIDGMLEYSGNHAKITLDQTPSDFTFNAPADTARIWVQNQGPGDITWLDDGQNPTATDGAILYEGGEMWINDIAKFKAFDKAGSSPILFALFYR